MNKAMTLWIISFLLSIGTSCFVLASIWEIAGYAYLGIGVILLSLVFGAVSAISERMDTPISQVWLGYLHSGLETLSLILLEVAAVSAGALSSLFEITRMSASSSIVVTSGGHSMDKDPTQSYREVDPTKYHRVVMDPVSGEEIVVHGKQDTSLRRAVIRYWGFSRFRRRSGWIIVDESGNDVTDLPLSSLEGIATITDEGESSSTLDSGTEFN